MADPPLGGWRDRLTPLFRPLGGDQVLRAEEYELLADDERNVGESLERSRPSIHISSPSDSLHLGLRRVAAPVPWAAWIIGLVEFAERASYYGVGNVIINFIQRPLPAGGNGTGAPPPGSEITPGALNMGLRASTAISTALSLLSWTMPLVGGVLADTRWGKFRTIAIGTAIAAAAHLLSVYSALPSLLQAGTAFLPFIISMFMLSLATGLIKANVAPIMAEQYTPGSDRIISLPRGEKVIIDREMTIQKIMAAYYATTNIGALVGIGSTFAEKYYGFWAAFLLPGLVFAVLPPLLYIVKPRLAPSPLPSSSALQGHIRAIRSLIFDKKTSASDHSLQEVKQGLAACKIFVFFIIYNVADGGLQALTTSLAGLMTTSGVPNDFLGVANPLMIVISIPLLSRYVYPYLASRNIVFGPVRRTILGFLIAATSMAYCAVLQHAVYRTSPCGYYATDCDVGTGVSPLSAWLFFPAPALLGISEALASVSAIELGYIMAPPSLRSMVNAMYHFTLALASLLVMIFVPLMHDPWLVWPFAITAAITVVAAWGVWRVFGHLDFS